MVVCHLLSIWLKWQKLSARGAQALHLVVVCPDCCLQLHKQALHLFSSPLSLSTDSRINNCAVCRTKLLYTPLALVTCSEGKPLWDKWSCVTGTWLSFAGGSDTCGLAEVVLVPRGCHPCEVLFLCHHRSRICLAQQTATRLSVYVHVLWTAEAEGSHFPLLFSLVEVADKVAPISFILAVGDVDLFSCNRYVCQGIWWIGFHQAVAMEREPPDPACCKHKSNSSKIYSVSIPWAWCGYKDEQVYCSEWIRWV